MLSSLVGLSHVLSAALATATFGAPIDWSKDGKWIAHLAVASPDAPALPPDWMLTPGGAAASADASAAGKSYRLWATRVEGNESVLIEESAHPLSSPTWSADGRSLVYGRFVPFESQGGSALRGRYEVVVQSGLDRKRSVVVHPGLELDAAALAALSLQKPAMNVDGRRVALVRPGGDPAVWIVGIESGLVTTVEGARSPAWSPDGQRLAYLRPNPGPNGEAAVSLHLLGVSGGERLLSGDPSLTPSAPVWGIDGQSILMLAAPMRGPFRHTQVDLMRISLEGFSARISTLEAAAPAPVNAPQRFRGPITHFGERPPALRVDLALDGEQEQGACLIESDGHDQSVKWYNVRTQNTFKKIHPLDAGLRLASPSLSPDGQTLALRVDDGSVAGLAFLCDLNTEAITLLAPDEATRERWLDRLAACAVDHLQTWLPMTAGDSTTVRATVLPLMAELGGIHPRQYRLQRIAKFALSLLDDKASDSVGDRSGVYRLFFSYLNRDYDSAERHLAAVEASADDPAARLRWLCLRAQVLLGQGEFERARGLIAYLDRETTSRTLTLEDSPIGPALTGVPSPENVWAKHLEQKSGPGALQRAQTGLDGLDVEDGRDPLQGLDPAERLPNLPFAPNPGLGRDLEPIAPDEFGGQAPQRPRRRIFIEPQDPGEGPAGRPFRAPTQVPPVLRLEVEG
ncbi:PD40 domain-containing protein [Paludisphaera soli]|uniref:PD40 domain-containing protein n=1 Tax=Paludisphaera soli TaxID=2712865 RepID=UPI0013EB2E25|nr:PD40 domain-containing protein [Paludisphaera soli]